MTWVYPRVCGGTVCTSGRVVGTWGLSPRVRGDLRIVPENREGSGSIPACAGEPSSPSPTVRIRRVYPRVCGGTISRLACQVVALNRGSIPACAGEPVVEEEITQAGKVYPRVMRGNLPHFQRMLATEGSIPACAGEP